jgi:hypothetical protein
MFWGNLDKRDVQIASAAGAAACVAMLLLVWGDFEDSGGMWLLFPFFGFPTSFAFNMILLVGYERILAPALKLGNFSAILSAAVAAFAIALISLAEGSINANDIAVAAMAAIGSGVAFSVYFSIEERSPAGALGAAEEAERSRVGVVSHLAAFFSALCGVAVLYAVGTALRGAAPDQILGLIFWGSAVPYLFLIGLMHALEFYQRGRKPLSDKAVISIAMALAAILAAALLSWSAANSSPPDPVAAAIMVVAAVVIAAITTSVAFRLHLRFRQ